MAETAVYQGENIVPEDAVKIFDDNVLAKLGNGVKGKTITPHGVSYWTRTARLDVEMEDGSSKAFFLKVAKGENGKNMMAGEIASIQAIHALVSGFVPTPIAIGDYKSDPSIHFFICSFHNLAEGVLDVPRFCEKVALMHKNSVSPTGKFGFHMTTHHGKLPQHNAWNVSWEGFFAQALSEMLELEIATQGPSSDIDDLRGPLFDKVIPRLLRPLETGGRSIKPCLVHGDLWYGNASTDVDSNEPIVYDACCFYAHNEYELGSWRPARNRFGKAYMDSYHQYFAIAEPREDYDDRVGLYSIKFHMHASALYTGNSTFREMMIAEMRRLVERYSEGFEGWEKAQIGSTA